MRVKKKDILLLHLNNCDCDCEYGGDWPSPQIPRAHRRQGELWNIFSQDKLSGWVQESVRYMNSLWRCARYSCSEQKWTLLEKFCLSQSFGTIERKSFYWPDSGSADANRSDDNRKLLRFWVNARHSRQYLTLPRHQKCSHHFQMSLTVTQNCPFMWKLSLNIDSVTKPSSELNFILRILLQKCLRMLTCWEENMEDLFRSFNETV